ncbi:MAG: hypothetical protein C5B54_09145 [Acidobacteria bacterium]|nr:MAG: hypothetical protein C5B54_09145 [Acidobacteriota bacterium]
MWIQKTDPLVTQMSTLLTDLTTDPAQQLSKVEAAREDAYVRVLKKPFSKAAYGSGGRFQACLDSGKSRALCAFIGRRAHGKASFQRVAARGRARAGKAETETVRKQHLCWGKPCGGAHGDVSEAAQNTAEYGNEQASHHEAAAMHRKQHDAYAKKYNDSGQKDQTAKALSVKHGEAAQAHEAAESSHANKEDRETRQGKSFAANQASRHAFYTEKRAARGEDVTKADIVQKYNPHHDTKGRFTSGGGGGKGTAPSGSSGVIQSRTSGGYKPGKVQRHPPGHPQAGQFKSVGETAHRARMAAFGKDVMAMSLDRSRRVGPPHYGHAEVTPPRKGVNVEPGHEPGYHAPPKKPVGSAINPSRGAGSFTPKEGAPRYGHTEDKSWSSLVTRQRAKGQYVYYPTTKREGYPRGYRPPTALSPVPRSLRS